MMEVSIIITSFKEPRTIGRAIEAFMNQGLKSYEILVLAPDEETLNEARKYSKKNKNVKVFKDPGKGKPAALNIALKKTEGKVIILSDGDVYVSGDLKKIIERFKDKEVGAVSGRVFSTNDRDSMFGYWAYILTESFHHLRIREQRERKVVCSGYLYAIRGGLIKQIPDNVLAEDAYISHKIVQKGYKSDYEPRAEVYAKYPTNLSDWVKQKKRTAGRLYQLKEEFKISKTQRMGEEIKAASNMLKEIKSIKQVFWFLFLGVMRAYIWFRVFFDFKLWKSDFGETWQRVESTK